MDRADRWTWSFCIMHVSLHMKKKKKKSFGASSYKTDYQTLSLFHSLPQTHTPFPMRDREEWKWAEHRCTGHCHTLKQIIQSYSQAKWKNMIQRGNVCCQTVVSSGESNNVQESFWLYMDGCWRGTTWGACDFQINVWQREWAALW